MNAKGKIARAKTKRLDPAAAAVRDAGRYMMNTYRRSPLVFVRGKGSYLLCQLPLVSSYDKEPMARELLARTGSLARVRAHLIRVLPKVHTAPNGSSVRAKRRDRAPLARWGREGAA